MPGQCRIGCSPIGAEINRSVFLEVKPRCPSQRYSDFATGRITPALNCHPLSHKFVSVASGGESKGNAAYFKTNHRRDESTGFISQLNQLTAFFTSAPILASSAAVNSFSAKAVGHMAPSSRFASCWKPNVAYLVLNFCALWKKQTT